MTDPRQSTVFDYSDLRLHPDGTRVNQKPKLTPRITKVAVRTSRKNWIARDAGGLSNVRGFKKKRKTLLQDLQADEEFISLSTGTGSPNPDDERKIKRFDTRTAKRRKFMEDYDYLYKDTSTSTNLASDTGTESFPYEPSSDLLKCIHRYASEFYTESDQLLNSSRDYRQQRKKGRVEKKAKERRTSKRYKDMYKVFDGSAIMAIGMLVQEYIAEALDPQPPDEWGI